MEERVCDVGKRSRLGSTFITSNNFVCNFDWGEGISEKGETWRGESRRKKRNDKTFGEERKID